MRTYHYNGEHWYCNTMSVLKRIRRWFVWIGGWEKANSTGWHLFYEVRGGKKLMSPAPIALFGHRIVHYGWGIDIRWKHRWICLHRHRSQPRGLYGYISRDGTPSGSTCWFLNPPFEITRAVAQGD